MATDEQKELIKKKLRKYPKGTLLEVKEIKIITENRRDY